MVAWRVRGWSDRPTGRRVALVHGIAPERLPSADGAGRAASDRRLQSVLGERASDDTEPDRGLGLGGVGGLRRASCAGHPGHQRDQLPHHGRAAQGVGRDRRRPRPGPVGPPHAGRGRGHWRVAGPGGGPDLGPGGPGGDAARQAGLGGQGVCSVGCRRPRRPSRSWPTRPW